VVATRKRAYDNSARAAAAQQTREKIMLAAVELFLETHYDDLTIARVAERAGVSPQTVVLHFKTKDGLVEQTMQWWAPREEAERAVETADPLVAAKKICARYEQIGPASLRILAIEERVPGVATLVEHGRKEHRDWVAKVFADQLGSGAARERRLMGLVVAFDVYTWDILRRRLPPDQVVQTMAELARGVLRR
jgi:AcrR family transcriptional regulator